MNLLYYYLNIRNNFFKLLIKIKRYKCFYVDTNYHVALFKERYFGIISTNSYMIWYIDVKDENGLFIIDRLFRSRKYIAKIRFTGDREYTENPKYNLVTANIAKKYKDGIIRIIRESQFILRSEVNFDEYEKIADEIINDELMRKF